MKTFLGRPFSSFVALLVVGSCAACSKDPEVAKREHFAQGEAYASARKYSEAVIEYRNAVQLDPRFGRARLQLAKAYGQLQDWPNAYREYIRAADLLPDNFEAQMSAAEMLFAAEQFDDAKARVTRALEIEPTNAAAQVMKGNIAAGLKDIDGAISAVENAISMDPGRGLTYANLGRLQWIKGDRLAAASAFEKAIEFDPTSVKAHLAYANFLWASGDIEGAEASLKRALEVDGRNLEVHRALAFFMVAGKRLPEAEAHFKALAELSTEPRTQLMLADFYTLSGRPATATPVLSQLAASKDTKIRTPATLRLAMIAIQDGRRPDGVRLVDALAAEQPPNATALTAQAELRLGEEKIEAAVRSIEKALQADNQLAFAHLIHGHILLKLGREEEAGDAYARAAQLDTITGAPQLALAQIALDRAEFEKALGFARDAAGRQPKNPDARLTLARALIARNQLDEGQRELEVLERAGMQTSPVLTTRGRLEMARGNLDAARRALDRAVAASPADAEALGVSTWLDLQTNRPATALDRVAAALAHPNRSPAVLLVAARTHVSTGDLKGAESLARKAVSEQPASLEAYQLLGEIYARTNRLPDAQREFEGLVQRQPHSVMAHTLLGMLLEMQGKSAEAEKRYEQTLAIDPRAAVAANNLGWLIAQRGGNLDVALQHAQTAVAVLPKAGDTHDTLGWIYYKKGMNEHAIASFKQAVETSPGNPLFHYHLGLAYFKSGYGPQARNALKEALRLHPNFDGAADARKLLASL